MDRAKIKKLAQEARIHNMRASGASVTEIVKQTDADERDVLDTLKVKPGHAVNNRPPRNISRGRKERP
jgi:transposase